MTHTSNLYGKLVSMYRDPESHETSRGQAEAAEAVARAVLRSAAKLARQRQPTGSFLFAGPTGVGKTELAKALAMQLFDAENTSCGLASRNPP